MSYTKQKLSPTLNIGVVVQNTDFTLDRRKELIKQVKSDQLLELTFPCVVFVDGTNKNNYRFYSNDLVSFAESFVDMPFLYDHHTHNLHSRHGIITKSHLEGGKFIQEIKITTKEGMLDFLRQRIDRFSIGWNYDEIICSICETRWYDCSHRRGQTYEDKLCEIYFTNPTGKEVSAVNVPAVKGTGKMEENLNVETPQDEITPSTPPSNLTIIDNSSEWLGVVLSALPDHIRETANRILAASNNPAPRFVSEVITSLSSFTPPTSASPTVNPLPTVNQAPALNVTGHGLSRVTEMTNPRDQYVDAWLYHFGGSTDASKVYSRSITQLYQDMTGDENWHGVVNREFALASANTVSLPNVVADALNRALIPLWDNYDTYRWYEEIVYVLPNNGSFNDMNMIQLGGISDLPIVPEGAAYTEATLTDTKEVTEMLKRGVYVGITLEMIRSSMVTKIRAIPQRLTLACLSTRSSSVANIFTSNSGVGPTLLQDSKALFHTDHQNLGTSAFSHSAWTATRTMMYKQPELGSGRAQAVWPRYCLLSPDDYVTGLEVFGYGSGAEGRAHSGEGRSVNPFGMSRKGDPRPIPIAVPQFTDTNDWAAVADPRVMPTIQMSYLNNPSGGSHPMPDIFSVTSEVSGLMFSNDTMPVKIRDGFGTGVPSWRGLVKNNVA